MFTRKPIFLITLMLLFTLLVTACGGKATNQAAPASGETTTTSSNDTASTETREYDTTKGKVTIPAKPLRIVTDYYAGELLAVGANVIGAEPEAFKNPFIKDKLKDATDVGAPLNAEKILELQPDLIVAMYDDNYDALSKIAPTVFIPYGTTKNTKETLEFFGDLTGHQEQAAQFVADYEKKAAEGREKIKDVVDANTTVGLYELTDKNALWVFGDNAGRGGQAVYDALQLQQPKGVDKTNPTQELSLEALPDYAADYMFLTTYDPGKTGEALQKLKSSAVWSSLPALKNGKLFYNDYDTFYRYDPIATMAQIDLFVNMILESNGKKAQ